VMVIFRWVLSSIFAFGWLTVAGTNWALLLKKWKAARQQEDYPPSLAGVTGGILWLLACGICPVPLPFWIWLLGLFLDPGSLLLLSISLYDELREGKTKETDRKSH
ncbi:MAG: hypothetical protein NTX30_22475, partial [Deltaproteobacteria bacterium]|nr:hypothetical protein [Deltaproteobacteria bacterium]